MKILIIEDEIELLIAISNFLIKENYIRELAENFRKASETDYIKTTIKKEFAGYKIEESVSFISFNRFSRFFN